MNRLADESSPYLQQHASNPVDWYPWGEEAIQLAVERDWPIFLSIGYSACHWCHVMEHESFSNVEIAELMNRSFINIKIDREERPDLDQIYMNSVMALTGRGGWPMSVFLTPDLKPFFCGTYWPPEARINMPGFRQILTQLRAAWDQRRDDINSNAGQLAEAVVQLSRPQGQPGIPDAGLLKTAGQTLLQAFDREFGGFGAAPKFPHPMDLRVLMRCWQSEAQPEMLDAVRVSCDRMAAGGIYDHLGGGFHRYSTDAKWLVPHFEKMLYDNGLLASVYVELLQVTGDDRYRDVLTETLNYVIREMTIPAGGFCSAQDADSEGEEGRFFVWSRQEVEDVLDGDQVTLFCDAYDVTPGGNWEGSNILNRPRPLSDVAEQHGVSLEGLTESLRASKSKLFKIRSRRIAPGTDDKVITAWNGMMISGMAAAARTLSDARYLGAAEAAADYVLSHMMSDDRLLHTARHDQASIPAFLDDYACLIDGLIELYQSSFDEFRLDQALSLTERMLHDFRDSDNGGFFYTAHDQSTPVTRVKDSQDGATPSGNGMAATTLLKLSALTGRGDFQQAAESTLRALDGQLRRSSMSGAQSLIAAHHLLGPGVVVVIRSSAGSPHDCAMHETLRGRFSPGLLIAWRSARHTDTASSCLNDQFAGRDATDGTSMAWVCERGRCLNPVTTAEDLLSAVQGVLPLPS